MAEEPTTTTTEETTQAVAPAVDAGATPAETKKEAKAAASKIDVTLSDEQLNRVADAVVDKFAANGAFDEEKPPPAGDGTTPAEEEGEETIPPKKSFAQRFAGVD